MEIPVEVILSTTHPTFKPLAGIVRINEAGRLKRALLNQLSLHRGASEIVLRSVYLLPMPFALSLCFRGWRGAFWPCVPASRI